MVVQEGVSRSPLFHGLCLILSLSCFLRIAASDHPGIYIQIFPNAPQQNDQPDLDDMTFLKLAQIRCIGRIPFEEFTFPEYLTRLVNPKSEYPTVRKFCAMHDLGGSQAWNAQAFCGARLNPPAVVFNSLSGSPIGEIMDDVFHAFAMELCQLRCRCVFRNNIVNLNLRNVNHAPFPALEVLADDVDPNRFLDPNPSMTIGHYIPPDARRLPRRSQVAVMSRAEHDGVRDGIQYTVYMLDVIDTSPKFMCKNEVVPLLLPPLFPRPATRSTLELCAAWQLGGQRSGNAGFLCLSEEDNLYSSNLLGHPAFQYTESFEALAIQLWCLTHCKCGEKSYADYAMLEFQVSAGETRAFYFRGADLFSTTINEGGEVDSEKPVDDENAPKITENGEIKKLCLSDSPKKCSSTLPTSQKLPSSPGPRLSSPETKYLQPLRSGSLDRERMNGQCGGPCTSTRDCASLSSQSCRCVIDERRGRVSQSRDSSTQMFPHARCLPLTIAAMVSGARRSGRLGKLGR